MKFLSLAFAMMLSSTWRVSVRFSQAWTSSSPRHQPRQLSRHYGMIRSNSNTNHNNYHNHPLMVRSMSTKEAPSEVAATASSSSTEGMNKMINLHTIPQKELEEILQSWGHPKYRAKQIWNWVRVQGVSDIDEMNNIPKKLKNQLKEHAAVGALTLDCELISKDGTQKRAYRLSDGQLIESVLMPYQDGRYTACISSQAGCAQGCVFCATGQMGFSRQLTPDEIFEQVARFASELAHKDKQEASENKNKSKGVPGRKGGSTGRSTRLSNVVFMGMGEPLANYRNVQQAVQRIQSELGIGHRRITISTVGIVPNIRKMASDLPQVRLAVSLHCANDEERTALLPANRRYGGLDELMSTLKEYIETTGKRVTLEWALIEMENDTPETAHQLGKLIRKWLRKDMVHVNVIPLNPTGGYGGSPSGRQRVNAFTRILEEKYGVACTPRVRRGIDINAGCGQLKSEVEKREREEKEAEFQAAAAATVATPTATATEAVTVQVDEEQPPSATTTIQVDFDFEDDGEIVMEGLDEHDEDDDFDGWEDPTSTPLNFVVDEGAVSMSDEEDWDDFVYQSSEEKDEASRLLSLVKDSVITLDNGIVGSDSSKDD